MLFAFFGIVEQLYFNNTVLCLVLFSFGFIGDIFDGIIARYLKMDTTKMRMLDSIFDTLFWLSASYLLFLTSGEMQHVLIVGIGSVIGLVFVEYVVCFLRFSRTPSSHNFISKFFGLFLFTFYFLGFMGMSPIVFGIGVFCFGFIARLDSLIIYLIVKEWTHDVPSSYHAYLIRNGKKFKRNKLFHSEHSGV
ncbi:MAG: CDP-alcohol phosphatidyltransferase family protein [Crocinitomicaceae bacterium]|nr:CDP-alcohol phosphatidyltransferase family protein [Crocinitomicaceae bacterium]